MTLRVKIEFPEHTNPPGHVLHVKREGQTLVVLNPGETIETYTWLEAPLTIQEVKK